MARSRRTWLPLDGEAAGLGELGDVAGRDGAVELAGLAGLAEHHKNLPGELFGDSLRLLAGLQIARLQLCLVAVEALAARLVGAKRHALRQEVVAREAVLDADDVAHLAELGNALQKNHFHVKLLAVPPMRLEAARGPPQRKAA